MVANGDLWLPTVAYGPIGEYKWCQQAGIPVLGARRPMSDSVSVATTSIPGNQLVLGGKEGQR